MKKILFGKDARNRIKEGVDKCCDVVKVSLGGYGKNVLIYNGSSTEIINDGVSIAQAVNVKDEVEQAGIQLAKQCANQTNEDAGDGTTTTLVLLQAILNEIITDLQTENPREVRAELFREAEETFAKIPVKQIESKDDVYNLALTSSLDKDVAKLVSEVYEELGKDAQVSIEETSRDVLEKEIVKGMKFESKRAEEKLIKVEETRTYEDVDVMVVDKAESVEDIQALVNTAVSRGKKDAIVIANQFSRPVFLAIMQLKSFNIVPIEYKMLLTIDDAKDYVGVETVEKVIVEPTQTTLIGGKGDVKEKIAGLQDRLTKEESSFEKENLTSRISSLLGRVAVIRVGKNTDVERQEAVLKVEDALGAVKGAYELGYTNGGGKALLEASNGQSERFQRICASPFEQICKNAGKEVEIPDTCIDSFKTVKHSLLNAISTGTSILTAEAALIEERDED